MADVAGGGGRRRADGVTGLPEKQIAKRTPVAQVEQRLGIGPNVVHRDDDLLDVARRAIGHPQTRVLAVVDAQERLVGVLPVLRVVEEVVAHAHPEALLAGVTDLDSASRFGREIGAVFAGDLMSAPVALRPDSTVADAFRLMQEHRYSGLPLVDDEGRVTGYIDLLELALLYLEEYPQWGRAPQREAVPEEAGAQPVGRSSSGTVSGTGSGAGGGRDESPDPAQPPSD